MRRFGFTVLGAFAGLLLGIAGGPAAMVALFLLGAFLGLILTPRRHHPAETYPYDRPAAGPMTPPSISKQAEQSAAFDRLIADAVRAGVIDAAAGSRLRAYKDRLWSRPIPTGPAPASAPPAPAPVPLPQRLRRVTGPGTWLLDAPGGRLMFQLAAGAPVTQLEHRGGWVRVEIAEGITGWVADRALDRPRPELATAPAPIAPAAPTAPPAPAVRPTPARPAAPSRPAPSRTPAAPPAPGLLEAALRRAGRGLAGAWKRFSADVAVHTFTYLGVLLLVVVIFVFFVGGFFGEMFRREALRPVVEVALPALLFGIAWLLRSRTGIPFTADAVGLIAALVLPICLSASFQDGLLCCPPDLNGSARWLGYVGVGVVWSAVCFLLSRRSRVYSYLVGPALWAGIGAAGLFLDDALRLIGERGWAGVGTWTFGDFASDGISAAQFVAVAGAIALTMGVLPLLHRRPRGKVVARSTVAVGAAALPVVTGFTLAFAYADAVQRGVGSPSAGDLAAPAVAAGALACLGLLAARSANFAWEGWGPRARRGLTEALTVTAYLLGTMAWAFTAGLGLPAGWVGTGLMALGMLVGLLERTSSRFLGRWVGRALVASGLILSLWDGAAATAAWGAATTAILLRPHWPALRQQAAALVPEDLPALAAALALWAGTMVTAGPGVARLAGRRGAPWVLAAVGLALGAARFLPAGMKEARSLSTLPAAALALSAVGLTCYQAATGGPAGIVSAGVILLLAAAAVGLALIPAIVRLAPSALLATAGIMLLAREGFGALGLRPSLADASALGLAALALLSPSLWRATPALLLSGALGHALVWIALGMSLRSETAALIGLGALVCFHAAEVAAVERGRPTVVTFAAARSGAARPWLEAMPSAVVAVALPFLTVLGGRRLPMVAEQRPRSGLVLSATSWGYAAVVWLMKGRSRVLVAAGAITVAGAGIAVTAPSQAGALIATASAALLAAACAAALRRPGLSALSWALAGAAALLGAARLGMRPADLHFVVYGMALAVLLLPVALDRARSGPGGGIRSRWLQAPAAVGFIALPAALALVVADGRAAGLLLLGGAAAYALLGLLTGAGGTAVPAAALAAMAYAELLASWRSPFDLPVLWLPFAAMLVLGHLLLPRRPLAKIATSPGPGVLVVALAVCLLAGVLAVRSGDLGPVLVGTAGLLAVLAAARRSLWWTGAAVVALAAGGLAYGDHPWAAAALAGDALVLGVLGTTLRLRWWVAASAPAAAGAYAALAWWQRWDEATVVTVTAAAAVLPLGMGAFLLLRRIPDRAGLWGGPLLALGQAGAVTVVAAAGGLGTPGCFGVWSGVAAVEALAAAVTAVVLARPEWTAVTATVAATAYGLAAAWQEWDPPTLIAVTAGVSALLGGGGLAARLGSTKRAITLWAPAALALSQAGTLTAIIAAARLGTPARLWVWAAAAAAQAGGCALAARRAAPSSYLPAASACFSVAAVVLALSAVPESTVSPFLHLAGVAGAAALGAAGKPSGSRWRLWAWLAGSGVAAAVPALAAARLGAGSFAVGSTLLLGGSGAIWAGIRSGYWALLYAGMLTWLGAAFLLTADVIAGNRHAYALPTAAVLLAIVELERMRARLASRTPPEGWRPVEWVLMVVPLLLALIDTVGNRMVALLLAGEGLALLVWSLFSRVRRRLAAGLAAVTAAVVVVTAFLVAEGFRRGGGGGTLLVVGGITAVLLIVIGSVIEKSRARIGRAIRRLGAALEDWE